MRLLLVDDDPKLRATLSRGLAESGHACAAAAGVDEALERLAAEGPFDLVLLDVMMPERPGWELLEELRRRGDPTPVIFLTARHSVDERVRGLRLGADDYVVKPFALAELLARIEAVARRREPAGPLRVGDLEIDAVHRTVERAGRRIECSPREFALLLVLAEARGAVVSRQKLLKSVWDLDFDPETNVVEVAVARLRRKLAGPGRARIETEVGRGYRLAVAEGVA